MKWNNRIGLFLLMMAFAVPTAVGTEPNGDTTVEVETMDEGQLAELDTELAELDTELAELDTELAEFATGAVPLSQEEAKAYIQVVKDYEEAYGLGTETELQVGLYQSRLLDFNGDGNLELMLFYISQYHSHNGLLGNIALYSAQGAEVTLCGELSVQNALYAGQGNRFVLVDQGDSWSILEQVVGASPGYEYFMEQYHRLVEGELVGTLGDYSIVSWTDITIGQDCLVFNGDMHGDTGIRHPVLSALGELEYYAVYEPGEEKPEETELPLSTEAPQHQTTDYGTMEYQYLQILQGYEAQYGLSDGSSMGLASSRLLDLDGNGTEELLLTVCTQTSPLSLRTEVWEMMDGIATATFVHSQGQKFYYQEDWRDRASLYSYQDAWVFIASGGGGSAFYSAYDRVYVYENGEFRQADESYFMRYPSARGAEYEFVAYVTGLSVETGRGDLVSQVLPSWYSGFQRIQSQYFGGIQEELFYIDKSSYGWVTDSVMGDLSVAVFHQGDWIPQGEVIIPQENSGLSRYLAYADLIFEVENRYGTSSGLDEGLAFTYLVDLTGDGQAEVLLGYCSKLEYFGRDLVYLETEYATSNGFTYEIWGYEGEEAVLLFSQRNESYMERGLGTYVYSLAMAEEQWQIVSETPDGSFQLRYEAGEFTMEQGESMATVVDFLSIVDSRRMFWATDSCARDLADLIRLASGSLHYYGYPVVFDGELGEKIAFALDLSQEILAMYQLSQEMYFLILDEDGGQGGLLVAVDDYGAWQVLERGMLSAERLETARLGYESGGITQAEVVLQPRTLAESPMSQEETLVMELALAVTLALAFGLWLLIIVVRRKN